jgi:hypothetical protein
MQPMDFVSVFFTILAIGAIASFYTSVRLIPGEKNQETAFSE